MRIINYAGIAALSLVAGCASPYTSKKASLAQVSQSAEKRYVDACNERSPAVLSEDDAKNTLLYETLEKQLGGVFEREQPVSRLSVDGLDGGIIRVSYDSTSGRRVYGLFSFDACGNGHKHVKAKKAFYLTMNKSPSGILLLETKEVPLARSEKVADHCYFHDEWTDTERKMRAELDGLEKSIDAEMDRKLFTFPKKMPEAVPDPVIPSKEKDSLLGTLVPKYVGDAY